MERVFLGAWKSDGDLERGYNGSWRAESSRSLGRDGRYADDSLGRWVGVEANAVLEIMIGGLTTLTLL